MSKSITIFHHGTYIEGRVDQTPSDVQSTNSIGCASVKHQKCFHGKVWPLFCKRWHAQEGSCTREAQRGGSTASLFTRLLGVLPQFSLKYQTGPSPTKLIQQLRYVTATEECSRSITHFWHISYNFILLLCCLAIEVQGEGSKSRFLNTYNHTLLTTLEFKLPPPSRHLNDRPGLNKFYHLTSSALCLKTVKTSRFLSSGLPGFWPCLIVNNFFFHFWDNGLFWSASGWLC